MSKTALLLFVLFGLLGLNLQAQTVAQSSTVVRSQEAGTHDDLKIRFSAISQSAADKSLALKSDDQNTLSLSLDGTQKNPLGKETSSKLSFRIHTLNSDGDLLMAVPEAYIKIGSTLTLGRMKTAYSETDGALEMGILNPLLTADQIRTEQQGVMGLHFNQKWGAFSLGFSAVGLYLPNQAPGVREENGRLKAANRWSATPPEKLSFNNELKDINYKITDIDYAKIVNHQGYIAGLGWAFEKSSVKASIGRLPMNDLVISREIFADLQLRPQVLLTPVVTYQDVITADFTIETGSVLTTLGIIQSQPDNLAAVGKSETQKISASTTVAVMAEYPIHENGSRIESLSVAIAETQGGDIQDVKSKGESSDFVLLPQRFKFNKPVELKAKILVWENRRQKILADVKYIYDREQRGSLLDTEISYLTALAGLTISAGLTLVGVNETNDDDKRFLYRSQVNDRIYGGLSYEF